jgi:hypothetical protein
MKSLDSLVREAWEELLTKYKSGKIILRSERDLERTFTDICRGLMEREGIGSMIANQEVHNGKRVDVRLGLISEPILVELKLYHDSADWKGSSTMRNTVENDLKFAKGRNTVYVGIIDVIPTSSRPSIPFKLQWKTIELDEKVFQRFYAFINPPTSAQRESTQRTLLANGTEI